MDGSSLRIAQIAPLYESVPPRFYGGTERVVAYLTEELVAAGHDVTLFASADSVTNACLVPLSPSLRLSAYYVDTLAPHILLLEEVFSRAHHFDILHFHIDYLHFPLSRRQRVPHITTLHGRLDLEGYAALYREYADMPVVSISHAQRDPLPFARFLDTVYHGIPQDLYVPSVHEGSYLAFLGRISPEKGVDRAVRIARKADMPLRIAGKVDARDREYFVRRIKPLLKDPRITYVGEVSDSEKEELLGNARALLFPIDWPEPFGLVMIEAMACGTPVIAIPRGSVPEVVEDGVTGFLVRNEAQAVRAVHNVIMLDRARIRRIFAERFTAARMARDYVRLYRSVARGTPDSHRAVPFLSRPGRTGV